MRLTAENKAASGAGYETRNPVAQVERNTSRTPAGGLLWQLKQPCDALSQVVGLHIPYPATCTGKARRILATSVVPVQELILWIR